MRKAHEPWIKKAEEDLLACKVLLDCENSPTTIVCFHCQQASEKFLKAYLTSRSIEFPKINDLIMLLEDYCIPENKSFGVIKNKLIGLTDFAINVRYPGGNIPPTATETKAAYEAALYVKEFVLKNL